MPALVKRPVQVWPGEAAFLPATVDPLRRAICARALRDLGVTEDPPSSNRGLLIDQYLRRAHVPEGLILRGKGWYCGAWAGAVWADAGALVPADYGSTDAWVPFLEPKAYQPQPGDAVLYGVGRDAHHIGIVLVPSIRLTIEANRSLGDGASNNGLGIFAGPSTRTDVLGYVCPRAA